MDFVRAKYFNGRECDPVKIIKYGVLLAHSNGPVINAIFLFNSLLQVRIGCISIGVGVLLPGVG